VSFAAITLRVASQRVFIVVKRIFRYRLSPETFGYVLADPETDYFRFLVILVTTSRLMVEHTLKITAIASIHIISNLTFTD
jgi:hypothetical protein